MSNLISEIMSICYEINQQTKAHCFFNYSGHVNNFSVQHFPNGWANGLSDEEHNKSYLAFNLPVNMSNLVSTKNKLMLIAEAEGVKL